MAAGCGEDEPTYSLKATASCFREQGYRVETEPFEERPSARDALIVSKGESLGFSLFFHDTVAKAEELQEEFESELPPVKGLNERRANVSIMWLDDPDYGPTRADFRALDRCVPSR